MMQALKFIECSVRIEAECSNKLHVLWSTIFKVCFLDLTIPFLKRILHSHNLILRMFSNPIRTITLVTTFWLVVM